jgi:competence ComEA-like helix-hairpin-helix protein
MKAKTIIADYFSFNRAEQRGISILLTVLLGLLVLKRILPGPEARPPANSAAFEKEVLAWEQELARAEEEKRKQKPRGSYTTYAFPAYAKDTSSRVQTPRAPSFTVDLNTADTLDLQRLRGIGPGFARRIVGYRNKLGGFVDKSQLLEVYGMDAERYAMIRDYVTVKGDSVRRIDLNAATFKSLIGHPYFPYELTKEIIIYRKKAKKFGTADELKNVSGVTDSVFRKVSPYIVVK